MKTEQNQVKSSKNESFLILKKFYLRTVMPKISGNEMKVLLFLIDSTDGWNQSEATLTNTRIADGSGIALNTVKIIIDKLLSYNLINAYSVIKKGIVMRVFSLQQDLSKVILPISKEKISSKVSNFFSSKTKKEVIKVEPIILNVEDTPCRELTPSQNSVPCQNSIVDPVNFRQDTLSILDSIKDINKKTNIKDINTYTCKENVDAVFEIDNLLKEELVGYGLYEKYAISLIKKYSAPFIWRVISYIKEEKNLGSKINNVGKMITYLINNPAEMEKDFNKEKTIIKVNIQESEVIEEQNKKTELPEQIQKGFSSLQLKTLQNILRKHGCPITANDDLAMANNLVRIKNKSFILELKESFIIDDLMAFLGDIRANKFFGKYGNLTNSEILGFWEIFEDPSLIQDDKKDLIAHIKEMKKTVMGLSETAMNSIRNAQRNLGLQNDFEEPIPC